MKRCTYCQEEKEVKDFSPQKTNPKKLYAWCDVCRRENNRNKVKAMTVRKDFQTMREKAISLRKFDDVAASDLYRRHTRDSVSVKELAAETGASTGTIYKTLQRVRPSS